tara:strand:+ start:837 stop:1430 length:594 start_codon:yes stop_codon:yes gene_type:complete
MVRNFLNSNEWSLILIRSGGYRIDNELNDSLFLYGRTPKEILRCQKNNLKSRLPSALIYLLKKANLTELALETGFIIDISKKNNNMNIGGKWQKFEQIILSSKDRSVEPDIAQCIWGVYSADKGDRCFEMIEITPGKLPSNVWIKVRPLDEQTLAWIISQNNLLSDDDKEQKKLDDFFDFNLPELDRSFLTLPGPPC